MTRLRLPTFDTHAIYRNGIEQDVIASILVSGTRLEGDNGGELRTLLGVLRIGGLNNGPVIFIVRNEMPLIDQAWIWSPCFGRTKWVDGSH